jgi:mannose-1-phosphate guanylyltransferase/phosphomannomutase
MRSLMEQADGELVLVDGVKVVYDDGWALVLPDPEEPITHVWAEAGSDGDARRRAQDHMGRIRRLLG